MQYRPDIDGLRAISIILVLLFHINLFDVTGGFIGVDVFFVISGYLITSIILRHIEKGDFSLLNFYERRIRRIFPALIAVLVVSLIFGWLLMMPKEFSTFGSSLAATSAFGSNIFFWREAGYFSMGGSFKPLLHTWSISVEEQFYIIFPLCLMVTFAWFKKLTVPLIFLSIIASLGLSEWAISSGRDNVAFYLLPTRAWELAIGSLLAFSILPQLSNQYIKAALSITGVALIVACGFLYTEYTRFPGLMAMVPTLGAAMFIYAGMQQQTTFNKLLSGRFWTFTGKISYSLYLWHWPIIVFGQYYLMRDFLFHEKIIVVIFCFFLAALSWKFIEQPFRAHHRTYNRKILFSVALSIMLILGTIGFTIHSKMGVPERFSDEVRLLTDATKGLGTPDYGLKGFKWRDRLSGDPSAEKFTYLIWGDSHANALSPALSNASEKFGVKGLLLKEPGCLPSLTLTAEDLTQDCWDFNQATKKILDDFDFEEIFLIARWTAYPRWFAEAGEYANTETRQKFKDLLSDTIKGLNAMGYQVHIVAEVPKAATKQVPSMLARAKLNKRDVNFSSTLAEYLDMQKHIFKIFDELQKEHSVNVIYLHHLLCDLKIETDEYCRIHQDGHSLYFDDDHLSTYGAEMISHIFEPYFKE